MAFDSLNHERASMKHANAFVFETGTDRRLRFMKHYRIEKNRRAVGFS